MNIQKIKDEKEKMGQPKTYEQKMIDGIVNKVTEKMLKHVCKRCTVLLADDTEKERGFCPKCWEVRLEQLAHERVERELMLKNRIDAAKREKEFKENQLKDGIKETMVIITGEDGKPYAHEGYVGGVKPEYMIHNDIADLNSRMKLFESQLENMKKAVKEDDRLTKPGEKGTGN